MLFRFVAASLILRRQLSSGLLPMFICIQAENGQPDMRILPEVRFQRAVVQAAECHGVGTAIDREPAHEVDG